MFVQGDSTLQAPPSSPFQTKDWAAAFSSQPGEFDYWIEEVEGTIPEYLSGTLFRNGPGNFGARHPTINPPHVARALTAWACTPQMTGTPDRLLLIWL